MQYQVIKEKEQDKWADLDYDSSDCFGKYLTNQPRKVFLLNKSLVSSIVVSSQSGNWIIVNCCPLHNYIAWTIIDQHKWKL